MCRMWAGWAEDGKLQAVNRCSSVLNCPARSLLGEKVIPNQESVRDHSSRLGYVDVFRTTPVLCFRYFWSTRLSKYVASECSSWSVISPSTLTIILFARIRKNTRLSTGELAMS